jgi:tRNA-binding protein
MLIKPEISWTDFEKIDIRCGTIISVNDFEKARNPSYQLEIDFGEHLGIKKSSAQITSLYGKDELIGKQILAVVNFPKKQIANFFSECLVLGVYGEDKKDVTLLTASLPVKNGMQVG